MLTENLHINSILFDLTQRLCRKAVPLQCPSGTGWKTPNYNLH